MDITLHWICGFQFGVEVTEAYVDQYSIGYLLIDVGIVRVQIAWYHEE